MSGFNEREKDFENKYAHDEKLAFKIEARCSKLFGLWVAEKIGLSGAEAQDYALEVVNANLEKPGYDDVLDKVSKDLAAKNIDLSRHSLEVQINKLAEEARKQVMQEVK